MLFQLRSGKTIEQIDEALRASAARHQFGILTVYDLRQTMAGKGVEFNRAVWVYEVCNPHQAKRALEVNGAVSTALPCRISVYEKEGGYEIATLLPTRLMGMLGGEEMESVAGEVEATLLAMIRETA